MAWRETERSKAVIVRRTYRCGDCQHVFKWVHEGDDETHPNCPVCVSMDKPPAPAAFVPPLPGVLTTKSKAIDYTQSMVEQDMGLTNFADNQRVGDIGFKPPAPMHTAEREALTRELVAAGVPAHIPMENAPAVNNFWQGNMTQAASTVGAPDIAKIASAQARAQGVDPVGMLEAARSSGNMPIPLNIVARSEG